MILIGRGENESPPRTPIYFGQRSSYHQSISSTIMASANLDDSMSGTGPVMLPLSRQNSRSMATTSKIAGYRGVFQTLSNIYNGDVLQK